MYQRTFNNKSWANVTGKLRAQDGLNPLKMDSLRARIPPSENMAHGPRVPRIHNLYPTIDDYYRVVHMEGINVPVPISSLEKPKRQGGWGLIDMEAKCRALLIGGMWVRNMTNSATDTWLREWDLDGSRKNRPHIDGYR